MTQQTGLGIYSADVLTGNDANGWTSFGDTIMVVSNCAADAHVAFTAHLESEYGEGSLDPGDTAKVDENKIKFLGGYNDVVSLEDV